ncbi:hypothetical protein WISP_111839 [Willisornis vidua]|uniref:LIN1 transcriptase n=1 Tax=Willisornis vidua TaxID=1566151 RepID=A0ABQ9D174_9PASS|nr:hypothetical protein WISP_111839 [Willisornis vidua]
MSSVTWKKLHKDYLELTPIIPLASKQWIGLSQNLSKSWLWKSETKTANGTPLKIGAVQVPVAANRTTSTSAQEPRGDCGQRRGPQVSWSYQVLIKVLKGCQESGIKDGHIQLPVYKYVGELYQLKAATQEI